MIQMISGCFFLLYWTLVLPPQISCCLKQVYLGRHLFSDWLPLTNKRFEQSGGKPAVLTCLLYVISYLLYTLYSYMHILNMAEVSKTSDYCFKSFLSYKLIKYKQWEYHQLLFITVDSPCKLSQWQPYVIVSLKSYQCCQFNPANLYNV